MTNKIPDSETYIKIAEWLDIYHFSEDIVAKEKAKNLIVMQMIPVVKRIARTIARRAYDPIEDLVQAGFIGLLKAIDRFDKEKNDNFRVYAGYLIIGEMKHYLRDKLNTIRVPRYIHELSIRINNFIQNLTEEEIRSLTSEEVASALEVSTQAVDYALLMERRRDTVSLEEVFQASEGLTFEELLPSEDYKDKIYYKDVQLLFEDVISKLPLEDKKIINLYYKQGMTQREISRKYDISRTSVARRLRHAFELMATIIAEKKLNDDLLDEKKNEDDE